MKWDILIRGGEVVDPSQSLRAIKDVAVQGGQIAEIGDNLPADQASRIFDARGLLVTPGLIDLHVHVLFYQNKIYFFYYKHLLLTLISPR